MSDARALGSGGYASPFTVELDRFAGPLDLLLQLIRSQNIDIFDIPIARITQQFLAAIDTAMMTGLEQAGEFLEVAATLIRIKAQMLFPRARDDEAADDPRADLVRHLLEYEHFREAARRMTDAEGFRSRLYPRRYGEPRPALRAAPHPLTTTWPELYAAARSIEPRTEPPDPTHIVDTPGVRVEDKIALVASALEQSPRVEFSALVPIRGTPRDVAATVLACLELAKRQVLRLRQASPFATLWLHATSEGR